MALILPRLSKFRLETYNYEEAIIFLDANDPDEACYKVFYNFSVILLKQDGSVEMALFLEELRDDFRIKKVVSP